MSERPLTEALEERDIDGVIAGARDPVADRDARRRIFCRTLS